MFVTRHVPTSRAVPPPCPRARFRLKLSALLLHGCMAAVSAPVCHAAVLEVVTSLHVQWTDNSSDEASFRIERRVGTGDFVHLADVSGAEGADSRVEFRDAAIMEPGVYTYRVRAENSSGVSEWCVGSALTVLSTVRSLVIEAPAPMKAKSGSAASFSVTVEGEVLLYQWMHEGVEIPGATNQVLHLKSIGAADAGDYQVRVVTATGTFITSPAPLQVVTGGTARLANLSARGLVGPGEQQLVPGVVIDGSGDKTVLVRAVGPTLAAFGVAGAEEDPRLLLYRGGSVVASNDNWRDFLDATALENARISVSAFALPAGSRDAALLATLRVDDMAYTAPVSGGSASGGVTLVEVYDVDPPGTRSRFRNLSARGFVGAGEQALTAGFVITGDVAMTLLLRAAGPSLAKFGVQGCLSLPSMKLYRVSGGQSRLVASNAGWERGPTTADLGSATQATGAFAFDQGSADAAVLLALSPGSYTVEVTGVGDTTGTALVELYVVP